jgi:hypothetical protein
MILERPCVRDFGEGVVHRREGDPGPFRLALRPVVAVDAQLRVVGEVGAELQEERPEVFIDARKVEVVDLQGCPGQP